VLATSGGGGEGSHATRQKGGGGPDVNQPVKTGPQIKDGPAIPGDGLTIYSSLPLQGGSRENAVAVNDGAKLALEEQGGMVDHYRIRFAELDDSTAVAGKWESAATAANARKAIDDPSTIAYLGEFNSAATAVSLPLLNRAGIVEVSPSNTGVGLTAKAPGADVGEPEKYYPTAQRNYARVVPNDTVQASAQATIWKENGCRKVYVVDDGEIYGSGLAESAATAARALAVETVDGGSYDPTASNYRSLAAEVSGSGADCFFGALIVDNNGVQLFDDVGKGNPKIKLFGPDGVAEEAFTSSDTGISASIAGRMLVTVATLSPDSYGAKGSAFFDRFSESTGDRTPGPYAIYGYEAMSLILTAIEDDARDGTVSRRGVTGHVLATRNRHSVLGTYGIDRNGDTTLRRYGVYRIEGGKPVFDKAVDPAEPGS
jgi:branched-chain amino acid transport system substrate-binding protein